jgi:hypothetical protein
MSATVSTDPLANGLFARHVKSSTIPKLPALWLRLDSKDVWKKRARSKPKWWRRLSSKLRT